ncbi:MAG: GYD domain-containing protein [Armatimonadota bacterium]|nr:GYD domain-containing protein [Armatimonadota bacterium]MDR7533248.1 GYD domain-containing protein [Armatimonadota bacterium]MDR7536959.1 GYD domain-containing protein [Armatimonadota bacterium]
MPKYLFHGSYTLDGVRGVLSDGGSKRREAARQAIESAGAKMEAFYFAFGTDDVVVLVDAPDNASAAALSLAIGAAGAFRGTTTVLLTPEEFDRAAAKAREVRYAPPGR